MTSEIKQRTVYQLVRTDKPADGKDVYVGSTSQPLNDRLAIHRYDTKRADSKIYKRMRTVGIYNWEILPLMSRTCDIKTIRELERKWCKILGADLINRDLKRHLKSSKHFYTYIYSVD